MNHSQRSDRHYLYRLIALVFFVGAAGLASLTEAYSPTNENDVNFTPDKSLVINENHQVTAGVGGVDDDQQALLFRTTETVTRTVSLTIEVSVPDFTPGTVYIYGNHPGLGDWDPGAVPMSHSGLYTWTITLDLPETTSLGFGFGRGSQQTEETEIDGTASVPARQLTVTFGSDGVQHESYSVANWRDPIVVDHFPDDGASSLPIDTTISASWNQAMGVGTDFQVVGPDGAISGTFSYHINTYTYVFTPTNLLAIGATYTVSIAGQMDAGDDFQQVPVQFTFDTMVPTSVDLMSFEEKPPITDSWWWVSWPWLMVLISTMSLSGLIWIKRRKRQTVKN